MNHPMLTANAPEILAFLTAWHENGRALFERECPSLVYDAYDPKRAKERRKYLALDHGTSGAFLVERTTGEVYSIKGYGVPNRRLGHLTAVTRAYQNACASFGYIGYAESDAALARAAEKLT